MSSPIPLTKRNFQHHATARTAGSRIIDIARGFGDPVWRTAYLNTWRMRRADFACWYARSHLSAGSPLESFWPDPAGQRADRRGVAEGKNNAGRKPSLSPAQLEALKVEAFRLFEEYGDPLSDNPHQDFNSKEKVIKRLQQFAVYKKSKDFPEEPPRTTIQPYVNIWLEEWRAKRVAEN